VLSKLKRRTSQKTRLKCGRNKTSKENQIGGGYAAALRQQRPYLERDLSADTGFHPKKEGLFEGWVKSKSTRRG